MNRVGAAQQVAVELRYPEVADLPGDDQVGHRAHRLFDLDVLRRTVQVVEIDDLDAKAQQRRVTRCSDVGGVTPDGLLLTPAAAIDAELRRQLHPVTSAVDRAAYQHLVVTRSVDVRRVDQRHTQLDGPADRRNGLVPISWAIYAHATEPDLAHREPVGDQRLTCDHDAPPISLRPVALYHSGRTVAEWRYLHQPVPATVRREAGRPRSEPLRKAILEAAGTLVAEHGFGAVTVEAIALRAHTSKTTIYRWWPGKAAVVMDAFLAAAQPIIEFPPTSSLRDELTTQMKALAAFFQRTDTGRTITALLAEAQSDPELAVAMRERWLIPRRAAAAAGFRRARRRGELREEIDDDALIDTLYGALYFRLMFGHAPIDDALVESVVDTVLDGVGPREPRRDSAARRAVADPLPDAQATATPSSES